MYYACFSALQFTLYIPARFKYYPANNTPQGV